MTIRVQGPDGATVEFPDDTAPEVMQSAMRAHYGFNGAGKPALPANQLPTATVTPTAQDFRDDGQSVPSKYRTGGETAFQKVNDFGNDLGDSFVHNLAKLPVSVAQIGAHGLNAMTSAGASTAAPGSVGANIASYVQGKTGQLDNAIQSNENQYQAEVPTNTASVIGAGIGNILPFAVGGEVAAIPKAATTLGKIGIGAATGGAVGALQPVTTGGNPNDPSFALEKAKQVGAGAALGTAIPIAARGASEVANLSKAALNPRAVAAENISRLVGSDPATLAKLDAAATPNNLGVLPTTAQAAPSPSSAAAEKALSNQPGHKEQFVQRKIDNNAARMAVLQGHAGDDVTMQAAKDARTAATQPFIEAHLQPATPATRWTAAAQPINDALSKPMVRNDDYRALQGAKDIIAKVKNGSMQEDDAMEAMKGLEEGVTSPKVQQAFSDAFGSVNHNMIDPAEVLRAAALTRNTGLGARPAVRNALDNITATINQSKNINGLVPADVLDSIRQNINDFLISPSGQKATAQEALGVSPIRDQLIKTVGQHAPGYSDYLASYAKGSTPINTMQAARSILESAGKHTDNTGGASPLTLNDINVGLGKIDRGRYGVSSQARNDLSDIQASLKREGMALPSPGSDTAYNINAAGSLTKNLLGPTFGGSTGKGKVSAAAVGALIGEHFGGPGGAAAGAAAGGYINKAASVINQRIMDQYSKGLLNPGDAATLIRSYLAGNPGKAQVLLTRYPQWAALLNAPTQAVISQKANP